jgi:uncharacterized protein (TIGR00369 family)
MPPDLDSLLELMPYAAHLGVRLESADADSAIATLQHRPELCTAAGVMHGGVLMSLADSLGAVVTFLGLPPGASTATITSTTQMFRPVTDGTVRAVATVVHRGRTTVTAQTDLYDDRERLVARTTQVQAVKS